MTSMNDITTQPRSQHTDRSPQVVVGLLIMLLGFGFLFDRMDVWHVHLSAHFWPLFPLFFGVARVLDGPRVTRRGRPVRNGVWLICIGIWGLISEFQIFGLDYETSWPLLIVAAGLNMVWRSLERPPVNRIEQH
jgi:LiaF transmembrane domain